MYVTQRYDPVFVEPNMKEYEVQVRRSNLILGDAPATVGRTNKRFFARPAGTPDERADR